MVQAAQGDRRRGPILPMEDSEADRSDGGGKMKRAMLVTFVLALGATVGLVVGRAQEATPADVTTELLGVGVPSGEPDRALQLIRHTLVPEGRTDPHLRAGIRLNVVESGTFGVTVISGRVVIWRSGDDSAPEATEPLELGVEHVLQPGEALFVDEGAVISSHAIGEEPLVVLQVAFSPADELATTSIPVDVATPQE